MLIFSHKRTRCVEYGTHNSNRIVISYQRTWYSSHPPARHKGHYSTGYKPAEIGVKAEYKCTITHFNGVSLVHLVS